MGVTGIEKGREKAGNGIDVTAVAEGAILEAEAETARTVMTNAERDMLAAV